MTRRRARYRFTGAHLTPEGVKILTWERAIPNDSRVEQITCRADWFWSGLRRV